MQGNRGTLNLNTRGNIRGNKGTRTPSSLIVIRHFHGCVVRVKPTAVARFFLFFNKATAAVMLENVKILATRLVASTAVTQLN